MITRSWIRQLFTRPVTRTMRKGPHRARPALEVLEDRCVPSTIVVNNPTDTPVAGQINLRQAIVQANTTGGDETIIFDNTVFNTARTITLAGSQLELSDTTGTETITGPAAGVTISGGGLSRVFQVDGLVTASFSGLTITGGNSAGNGGGLVNRGTATLTNCTVSGNSASGYGGGLFNNGGTATLTNCTVSGNSAGFRGGGGLFNNGGTATLTNCTVSGNSANFNGGGLFNRGTATLTNCTVSGNSARYDGGLYNGGTATLTNCTVSGNSAGNRGGGLYNRIGGTATLTNCTVSGNSAARYGGGLYNHIGGTATLTNCTVSGNSAGNRGGGLYNRSGGTATLTNCTVSGNSAGNGGGGGLYNGGTATLTNCTVSGNSAGTNGRGGGLDNRGTATLTNTIVAGNTANSGPDALGTFASRGNNLIGKTDGSSGWVGSDLTGTITQPLDPLLAALGDYGGPTQTMALLPGSPAIDAGNNALIPAGVTTDQRGFARIVNGTVDIGAFEVQAPTLTVAGAQTAYENVDQPISSLSVGDVDSNSLTVTLAVSHGTLTLGSTSGLTVSGNGSGSVSLSGSSADLNAALASLVYRGAVHFSGDDTLSITASDGRLSTSGSVAIHVQSAAEQAADLQNQVSALQSAGILNNRLATLLTKTLQLQGNVGDNLRVVAFLLEVRVLRLAGILTPEQADALLGPGNILLLSVTRR